MSIKQEPIVGAWNVDIFCDKCNERMVYQGRVKKHPNLYEYKCECCGNVETSEVSYPYQRFKLDLTKREEIDAN